MSKLYVVNYTLVGERCNGSWLVNAANKREAGKLIRDHYKTFGDRIVVDYTQTIDEYRSDMGYEDSTVESLIEEGMLVAKGDYDRVAAHVGEYEQIECGT